VRQSPSSGKRGAGSVPTKVSVIILAAGSSTRFGGPKLLSSLPATDGRSMIQVVVDAVLHAGLHQIIVVVGCYARHVADALCGQPIELVMNHRWREGLSSSVHAGLEHLSSDSDAAIFILADQPAISPQIIRVLMKRYQETHAPIVAPTYRGQRGNPVLFDLRTFNALQHTSGDQGGRQILRSAQFDVATVEVEDAAILIDTDTPGDLTALAKHIQEQGENL